jgi:hypothetical protein
MVSPTPSLRDSEQSFDCRSTGLDKVSIPRARPDYSPLTLGNAAQRKTSHLRLEVDDHTGLINTDTPGSKGLSPFQDVFRLLEIGWTIRQRKKVSGSL